MNTKGHCFQKTVILQAVYFKLRFTLSYRDIEEIYVLVLSMLIIQQYKDGFINSRQS